MHVALDDFGTGYANLDVLLALRFDQVKLDAGLRARPGNAAQRSDGRGDRRDGASHGMRPGRRGRRDLGTAPDAASARLRLRQGWLIGKPLALETVLAGA